MRLIALAVCAWAGLTSPALALEIKNVRPCYAPPFAGPGRTDLKIIPGDTIFLTYDIENLRPDAKGKLVFDSKFELLDSTKKVIFANTVPGEALLQLGGNRVPGQLAVEVPPSQAPGKYKIRLTIVDKNAMEDKAIEYDFVVGPANFGLINIMAPTFGFIGTYHVPEFGIVNMALDKKGNCKVDLVIKVLDEATKKPLGEPIVNTFPKDMPRPDVDLTKENFIHWRGFPIYLNRTGRFIIEITATDRGGTTPSPVVFRYPFAVIDSTTIMGK